jgi:hypothetical protein
MNYESKIFVKHHLGMGDIIVHNGMIRKIAEDNPNSEIFLASKYAELKNVKYMFRDNTRITVIGVLNDNEMFEISNPNNFDKIITSHFCNGTPYSYDEYFDDAFYLFAKIDPIVKTQYFHIERDHELENRIFDELITSKGITDYLFVHEKPELNINIDRNRLDSSLPIITADPKYGIFELLKVIEMAKSVNVISSSFLSLMMCKKYNQNVFAHMYCDRGFLAPYIKKHNIEVLL